MKIAVLLIIALLCLVQNSNGGRYSSSRGGSSSRSSSSSSSRSSSGRSSSSRYGSSSSGSRYGTSSRSGSYGSSSRSGSSYGSSSSRSSRGSSGGSYGSSSSRSSGSRSSSSGSSSIGSRSSSIGSRSSSIGSRSGSRISSSGSRSISSGSRISSSGSRSSSSGSRISSSGSRSSSSGSSSIGSRSSSSGSRSSSIGSGSSSIGSRSSSIGSRSSSSGSRSSGSSSRRVSVTSRPVTSRPIVTSRSRVVVTSPTRSSIGLGSGSSSRSSGRSGSISSSGSSSRSGSISSSGSSGRSGSISSSRSSGRSSSGSISSSGSHQNWGATARPISHVQYQNNLKNYGIPTNHQYPKNYGTVFGTRGTSYGSHGSGSFGSKVKQKLFGSNHGYGSKAGSYSYKSPGYGTNWGTSFGRGKHSIGRYKYGKKSKKGYSKKALGLGVAAGFLGGAAVGAAGTAATYGVYHRYNRYKQMMYMNQHGRSWDSDPMYGGYYSNYYTRNQCLGGCYGNSHCEWGFCECNPGYERKWGRCELDWSIASYRRPSSFDPFQPCSSTSSCLQIDFNLICNTDLSVQGPGRCQCRNDMRWNTRTLECELYIDVDCSRFTYDTPASPNILSAVDRAMADLDARNDPTIFSDQANIENVMANSLLTRVDPSASTQDDIREAFCRDVDSFSHEFRRRAPTCVGKDVPPTACAIIYDEEDCMGWHGNRGKQIPIGDTDFGGRWSWMYGNSMWKYRNDIESVSVRAGCYLTMYVDNKFQDNSAVVVAGATQRDVNLEDEEGYAFFEENIESVRCACD